MALDGDRTFAVGFLISSIKMFYQFDFRPYQRLFQRPLHTSHGSWHLRQGLILRAIDETGKIGWGEVAPIPWFGSETWEEAIDFCQQLPSVITWDTIESIPDNLPACQFGLETAMTLDLSGYRKASYCGLLPSGGACLHAWKPLWKRGYRTFKWKIGVRSFPEEVKIFEQLISALPTGVKFRLDANGGLSLEVAKRWLEQCEITGNSLSTTSNYPVTIVEFIEQPLSPEKLDEMQQLAREYSTPIALDESVSTLKKLEACYQQGWRGIFVIKAGIAGSPSRLRQFWRSHSIDGVFSSVMETSIGRNAAIKLALELQNNEFALGFGVEGWFGEDEEQWLKQLWNN